MWWSMSWNRYGKRCKNVSVDRIVLVLIQNSGAELGVSNRLKARTRAGCQSDSNTSRPYLWKTTSFWLELLTCKVGDCWECLGANGAVLELRHSQCCTAVHLTFTSTNHAPISIIPLHHTDSYSASFYVGSMLDAQYALLLPCYQFHSQMLLPESSRFHGDQFYLSRGFDGWRS